MSNILEKFGAKRIRLTRELRRAVMSGDNYLQFRHVLEVLDDLEATYQMMLGEARDAIARFNQSGGVLTRLEDGRLEFRIGHTSLTLTVDEDKHIQDLALAANVRDRDKLDIILRMIKAIQDRPLIEQMIGDVLDTRERLEREITLSGYAELRSMIRGDTGLSVMTISGMDEEVAE